MRKPCRNVKPTLNTVDPNTSWNNPEPALKKPCHSPLAPSGAVEAASGWPIPSGLISQMSAKWTLVIIKALHLCSSERILFLEQCGDIILTELQWNIEWPSASRELHRLNFVTSNSCHPSQFLPCMTTQSASINPSIIIYLYFAHQTKQDKTSMSRYVKICQACPWLLNADGSRLRQEEELSHPVAAWLGNWPNNLTTLTTVLTQSCNKNDPNSPTAFPSTSKTTSKTNMPSATHSLFIVYSSHSTHLSHSNLRNLIFTFYLGVDAMSAMCRCNMCLTISICVAHHISSHLLPSLAIAIFSASLAFPWEPATPRSWKRQTKQRKQHIPQCSDWSSAKCLAHA